MSVDALQLALDQLENAMEITAPRLEREESALIVPDLGLRVAIVDLDIREHATLIVYAATPFEGEGILVLAAGRGETFEQQLAEGTLQWTSGVFTVLQHWLAPSSHSCLVGDLEFSAGDDHWRLHSGPVISRYYGDGEAEQDIQTRDIPMVLFGALTSVLPDRSVFWIEAFVVRHDDETIDATCRVRNEDFEEGRESLIAWASDWKLPAGVTMTARQFLLYEPIAPPKKSWWKRLVGR